MINIQIKISDTFFAEIIIYNVTENIEIADYVYHIKLKNNKISGTIKDFDRKLNNLFDLLPLILEKEKERIKEILK